MIADPSKKTLIIVESPTKARTISRFLPPTCKVIASMGHIVDLAPDPKSGRYGVDVDHDYKLEYVIDPKKKELIQEMKTLLSSSEQLVLATDEDREGESISWHLMNVLKPSCPVFRMVFHEITKSAILNAFSSCRELDMNLVHAQEARRAVDRLQGYGISPILSRKLSGKYSAGRVQSPGLKLVVEREKERRAFRETGYYSVETEMVAGGTGFQARLKSIGDRNVAVSQSFDSETGELKKNDVILLDSEKAEAIAAEVKGKEATVFSVANQEKIQKPAMPFTTSTLQQDAARKMHKSVKEIMSLAQQLYEKGFITYMRTDSPTLSVECINAARAQVGEIFGSEYLSSKPRNYKATSETAQEAHEAIRPAGDHFRKPEDTGLSGDALRLYTIIWRRTLATQMKEAEKSTTTATLTLGDYTFTASGTTIRFPGYLRLYDVSTDDDEKENEEGVLPLLVSGEHADISKAEAKSHTTKPPARYTEASLVQKLESDGIGRPSTYAAIISTLIDRKYVIRQSGQLVPTFTGFFVDSFLEMTFPAYIDTDFTSKMEEGLDKIAGGTESKSEYLDSFWRGGAGFPGLDADLQKISSTVRKADVTTLQLPGLSYTFKVGENSVTYSIRISKFGPYLASDYFDKEAGKTRMASLDQAKYFPGTFSDCDAKTVLFPQSSEEVFANGIVVAEGRYGKYLKTDDGRNIMIPRPLRDKLTPELAQLLAVLPKSLGKDTDGEDILMMAGPYGFYAKYMGKNITIADPFNPPDAETIRKSIEDSKEKAAVADFGMYQDKPLQILNGRYGAYIKWGDKNFAIPKQEQKNASGIGVERAIEIVSSDPEKLKVIRDFGTFEDLPLTIQNGRYGAYIKWGDKNVAIPSAERSTVSEMTAERAQELAKNASDKKSGTKRRKGN
ncbi:MAG: type I DNA topoisomerase [Spirochaetes bacterium]|uniref:DNA topoisomerase 1 n=1 Tax=Candidatus Ornithospirochaeta stercoripullorum TaxID=2840899 RepID=A0A9D9H5G5_9SPIO|nr:type I DNA topoisomerase [Candidatus Ornithospirochaeta stercoripullorum]